MNPITRRSFLQKSTVAIGASLTAGVARSTASTPAGSNDAIRLGIIGLNGKGSAHLKNLLKMPGVRVTALCDVDPKVLERAAGMIPDTQLKPFKTTEARELINHKEVDAVMVVTSNHWHALHTVWACQAGKDVYVEKPMCHTVWEGRKMIEATRKYNRIVQVGTHYRSETGLRDAIQYLHEGQLGKIKYIRAVVYNIRPSIGRQLPWYPEGLSYDTFCGPTPMVPLDRPKLHYDWHWVWNTGNGELGNNGVHVLDIALRIAKHNAPPKRILSYGGRYVIDDVAETPNTHFAAYDYDGIPLYFEHRALPAKPGVNYMDPVPGLRGTGVVAYCEGGYVSGLVGAAAYDPSGKVIKKFPGDGGAGHVPNFFAAVRSRRSEDLAAPVETGHLSAALCHWGNISYRIGRNTPAAKIQQEIQAFPGAGEIHEGLEKHLTAHGVDTAKKPFRMGPWLQLEGDEIKSVSAGGEKVLAQAKYLVHEAQRPPFVIPEKV